MNVKKTSIAPSTILIMSGFGFPMAIAAWNVSIETTGDRTMVRYKDSPRARTIRSLQKREGVFVVDGDNREAFHAAVWVAKCDRSETTRFPSFDSRWDRLMARFADGALGSTAAEVSAALASEVAA